MGAKVSREEAQQYEKELLKKLDNILNLVKKEGLLEDKISRRKNLFKTKDFDSAKEVIFGLEEKPDIETVFSELNAMENKLKQALDEKIHLPEEKKRKLLVEAKEELVDIRAFQLLKKANECKIRSLDPKAGATLRSAFSDYSADYLSRYFEVRRFDLPPEFQGFRSDPSTAKTASPSLGIIAQKMDHSRGRKLHADELEEKFNEILKIAREKELIGENRLFSQGDFDLARQEIKEVKSRSEAETIFNRLRIIENRLRMVFDGTKMQLSKNNEKRFLVEAKGELVGIGTYSFLREAQKYALMAKEAKSSKKRQKYLDLKQRCMSSYWEAKTFRLPPKFQIEHKPQKKELRQVGIESFLPDHEPLFVDITKKKKTKRKRRG